MAELLTFVKINRNILRWSWYTDVNTFKLFLHLILTANVKTAKWRDIVIKRGQLVTSLNRLAEETGLSQRQVRTALEHLKSTQEVTQYSEHGYTLITVQNYELYQDKPTQKATSDRQSSDKAPTKERQQLKNNKKDNANALSKNEKKGAPAPVPADAVCSPREWEIEHKVPERFIGRFPNFEMWEEWRLNH